MKNSILLIVIALIGFTGFSQKKITWNDLANVTFESKYNPEEDRYFLNPKFAESIKALDGEKISISGYFLDIDPRGETFVLSQGPMSACFFCGVGGPETAMELRFEETPKFKMDDIVTITGILELNSDDLDSFNYVLKECRGELSN